MYNHLSEQAGQALHGGFTALYTQSWLRSRHVDEQMQGGWFRAPGGVADLLAQERQVATFNVESMGSAEGLHDSHLHSGRGGDPLALGDGTAEQQGDALGVAQAQLVHEDDQGARHICCPAAWRHSLSP